MSIERQLIMNRSAFIDDETRAQLVEAQKAHVAAYNETPTHAICRHGIIVESDAVDHVCGWQMLVRE